jgi:hypothetical protein
MSVISPGASRADLQPAPPEAQAELTFAKRAQPPAMAPRSEREMEACA